MLPADVYARFQRARGNEVLSICGTDDHGTPAELAAAEAGQDVFTYCDGAAPYPARPRASASASPGTSSVAPRRRRTRELTHHFAAVLEDNGLIEERVDQMVYSLDRQALPAGPLRRGHLPDLRLSSGARRPVRQLWLAARSGRPDRALFGDLRLDATSRCARPATSTCCSRKLAERHPRLGRDQQTAWPPLARSIALQTPRRGPDRPRHHPRPLLGLSGAQGRPAAAGL